MQSCKAEELQREQFATLVRLLPTMYLQMMIFAPAFGLFLYVVNGSYYLAFFFVPLVAMALVRERHWRRLRDDGYDFDTTQMEQALRRTTTLGIAIYFAYSVFAFAATYSLESSLIALAMLIVWASAIAVSFYLSTLPHAATGIVLAASGSTAVAFAFSVDTRMIAAIPIVLIVAAAVLGLHRAAFKNFRQLVLSRAKIATLRGEALDMAMTDTLTGLPNRRAFDARLQTMLAESRAFCVAMIDLDGFKPVNDVNGHAAGDACLIEAARRLGDACGQSVFVARMGGDEFALLLRCVNAEAIAIAERAVAAIAGVYVLESGRVTLGASCGVAACEPGGYSTRLLERADIALYRAKAQARGGVVQFSETLELEARNRALLEQACREAIERDEFDVCFQPIVCVRTRQVTGFEALARWRHAELGEIPPDAFIPLAEQIGLIEAVSDRLLRKAVSYASRWPRHITLAFNLSAKLLTRVGVERDVILALARGGLSSRQIEIELTETAIMSDCEAAARVIGALKSCGVRVSLDDFGSGYSSFGQLSELAIDKLKIDKKFVQRIDVDDKALSIARAIIGMCADLGVVCVAEGVETEGQLQVLRQLGCDLAQGYLFSRPMRADAVESYLDAQIAFRKSA